MTALRAAARNEICTQHHVPRSECEPWDKHGHTMRFREDDWQQAMEMAETDVLTPWVAEVIEARLQCVRCLKCDNRNPGSPPVPLVCGDLTGGTLDEWIGEAVKRVRAQHPRHEPVWLGREPAIREDAVCAKCDAPWSAGHVCDADHQKLDDGERP